MGKRSVIIGAAFVTALVVGGLVFLWLMPKERPADTGMNVQSMPAADSAAGTTVPKNGDVSTGDAVGSGTEDMTLDQLMDEIEDAAGGDETALDDEYTAETESFMDGAVVMQELGASYDETSY